MKPLLYVWIFLMLWTSPSAAQDAPDEATPSTLRLADAMAAAVDRLDLVAAESGAAAAREEARTVRRLGRLPEVEAGAGYQELDQQRSLETPFGPLNVGPKGTGFANLEVRQPLVDVATRRHKAPAAELAADAAGLLAERVRQELMAEAGRAFLDVLRLDARLATTRAFLESLDGRTRQVEALVAEGRALEADLLKIRLSRDDARLEEIRLLNLRGVALEELARTMGSARHHGDAPAFERGESPAELDGRPTAIERAWRLRPDVQALEAEARALRASARGVRAERLPRLDARLRWERLDPSPFTEDSVAEGALSLSWKPFASGTRKTRAAAEDARAEAAGARLEEARRAVRVEVLAVLAGFDTAREALEVRTRDVHQARETLRVESERYRSGRSTLDDVLEYEAILRQRSTLRELAEIDLLAADIEYRLATGVL